MSSKYKLYHPRWYRRRMPIFWWLGKFSYTRFISRELTSLAVAYAAVLLVVQTWALSRGEAAYARFLDAIQSTPLVLLHTVVFVVLLFHTITWLNLAPKALVIRVAGRRLPNSLVVVGHYLAWLSVSALVAWVLLRG